MLLGTKGGIITSSLLVTTICQTQFSDLQDPSERQVAAELAASSVASEKAVQDLTGSSAELRN